MNKKIFLGKIMKDISVYYDGKDYLVEKDHMYLVRPSALELKEIKKGGFDLLSIFKADSEVK